MVLERILKLPELLDKKSFFLFGPRSTGKSSLVRDQLKANAFNIDLLDSELFLRLSQSPKLLEQLIHENKKPIVVIDEIQKIPALLDEVQRLIFNSDRRFLLTGSSARKLTALAPKTVKVTM